MFMSNFTITKQLLTQQKSQVLWLYNVPLLAYNTKYGSCLSADFKV